METPPTNALYQFVTRYWRGDLGLITSTLVMLLGVRLALVYVQPLVPASPALWLIGFCLLANGAVLVWQVVSSGRAAERNMRETGDLLPAVGSYFIVLVAVVLTAGQWINAVFALYPVEIDQSAGLRPVPVLPISDDGRTVTLAGDIDYRLNTALIDVLAANPGVRRVTLTSDGGHIFAARAIALNIAARGLNTHVTGACRSACTIAFIAGAERSLGPDGQLGFHHYGMDMRQRVATVDYLEEEEKDRRAFARQGVSAAFLERMFRAGQNQMWTPERGELFEAGVITRP